jgi:hypothetical protein
MRPQWECERGNFALARSPVLTSQIASMPPAPSIEAR